MGNEKDYVLVNGKNYYNEESLQEMIQVLDSGKKLNIYIDCIGHTRAFMEESNYVDALRAHYRERFHIDTESSWCPLYYVK